MREIFTDYCCQFEHLRQFFLYDPRDLENAISDLRVSQPRRFDESQLNEIRLYNQKMGCGEETLANIDKLAQGGTLAVVTGQQAGIFTGPLYTIYKALTAIKLAQHITHEFRVQTVPIFWNASEDHDFREVRETRFISRDDRIISLIYEPSTDIEGKSIFDIPLEPSLDFLVDLMDGDTNESEFKPYIVGLLRDSLGRSYSLADWFSQLMHVLFSPYGLIMVDAHLPPWRQLARPVIEREINEPLDSSRLINEVGHKIENLGYYQQIVRKEDDVNFFFYAQGRRNKVRFNNGRFLVDHVSLEYDKHEMLEMLAREPERFSPSVVLRPLVQDHILPTAAYVAGPGEVSYFAQMRTTYSAFDVVMPVIFPRSRVVIVEPKIAKIMEKHKFGIDDARRSRKELIGTIMSRLDPKAVAKDCDGKLERLQTILDEFRFEVHKADPTLVELVDKLKDKINYEMNKIRERLLRTQLTDVESVDHQVDRLKTHLFPEGKEQERVLNIFPYLFAYGIQLIPLLEKAIDIMNFDKQKIYV